MLEPLVPTFHYDLSVHLKDTVEKLIPVKLKPIVDDSKVKSALGHEANACVYYG